MDKSQKKKIVSVNFNRALFSLLDFLTLEDGTDMLPQNISGNYPSTLCNIPEE